ARGPRAVSRPSRRRVLRTYSHRPESPGHHDQVSPEEGVRGTAPRRDRAQAQDRVLPRRDLGLVPRADRRGNLGLPARLEPPLRGDPGPRDRREARQRARGRPPLAERATAALDPAARDLDVDVLATGDAGSAARAGLTRRLAARGGRPPQPPRSRSDTR